MSLCLLGYQFLKAPQPEQGRWTWKGESGIDVPVDKPFCVHAALWDVEETKNLKKLLQSTDEPASEEVLSPFNQTASFDWIEMMTPTGLDRLHWDKVRETGLIPLVRFADDEDVAVAIAQRPFRGVSYCVNYGAYDPTSDQRFSILGYDIDGTSLHCSALIHWGGEQVEAWRNKYAHELNRWHLFSDFQKAKEAACDLYAILHATDPDAEPLIAVGIGLSKETLDSLRL